MFMSLFVVSDRKGLLRWRNSKHSWLVAGVQRPVMRDTLPSVKAEFWSGYDCVRGPVPRSAIHEIGEKSLTVRELVTNQSPRQNHRERITL